MPELKQKREETIMTITSHRNSNEFRSATSQTVRAKVMAAEKENVQIHEGLDQGWWLSQIDSAV